MLLHIVVWPDEMDEDLVLLDEPTISPGRMANGKQKIDPLEYYDALAVKQNVCFIIINNPLTI